MIPNQEAALSAPVAIPSIGDMMDGAASDPVEGLPIELVVLADNPAGAVTRGVDQAGNDSAVAKMLAHAASETHNRAATAAQEVRLVYDDIVAFGGILAISGLPADDVQPALGQSASRLLAIDEQLAKTEVDHAVAQAHKEAMQTQMDQAEAIKAERQRLGRPLRRIAAASGAVILAGLLSWHGIQAGKQDVANAKQHHASSQELQRKEIVDDAGVGVGGIFGGVGGAFGLYVAERAVESRLVRLRAWGSVSGRRRSQRKAS